MKTFKKLIPLVVAAVITVTGCGPTFTVQEIGDQTVVINKSGQVLGYSPESGVSILTVNRLAFKDLNQNGELDPYEDWRLSVDERAVNLVSQMSVEQMAGLMLYSLHQSVPSRGMGRFGGAYNGQSFEESGALPEDLSDAQVNFLK